MANHSFVRYNRRRLNLKSHEVEVMLKSFVVARFGGHVVVERVAGGPMERQGYTVWHCVVPGSAIDDPKEAMSAWLAPGELIGFPVWYKPGLLEFRHVRNEWARWAQKCVEEDFAIHLRGTMEDEGDSVEHKAVRDASNYETVRDYLSRNLPKPLAGDDLEWIDRLLRFAPKIFRE